MKKSFFERITGSIYIKDDQSSDVSDSDTASLSTSSAEQTYADEDDAQLAIDMYQTRNELIVVAMTAGVKLEGLDVSINNDVLSIRGIRSNPNKNMPDNYIHQELYWGPFSRTIVLPNEVDPDETTAEMSEGLLTIKMPKIDRTKTKTLKIRTI